MAVASGKRIEERALRRRRGGVRPLDHRPGDVARAATVPRRRSQPPTTRIPAAEWADWDDEQLLDLRLCDLDLRIEGSEPRGPHRGARPRARGAGPAVPAALLALRRVVLARRRARRRHPLLPRPPAPGAPRAEPDARGGGRHPRVVPADPAPRGRPRHRERLPPAAPAAPAGALRQDLRALPRVLHAQALQQELRASTSTPGTRRATPTRTSPRPSRCGSPRARLGARATPGWPALGSSSTWTS